MSESVEPVACVCGHEALLCKDEMVGCQVSCQECGREGRRTYGPAEAADDWNKMQLALRSHDKLVAALKRCANSDCTGPHNGCSGGGCCAGCNTGIAQCKAQQVLIAAGEEV